MPEPRFLSIEQLTVGDRWTESVTFDAADVRAFAEVSGDFAPQHLDDTAARANGFGGAIVHGLLVGSRFSRILGMYLPGAKTVIHTIAFDMVHPIPVGSNMDLTVSVTKLHPPLRTVALDLTAQDEKGVVRMKGRATCVFRE